jgi:3-oxoadipate enol-lactonase
MPKVKVNDVNLYYEVQGKGEPLILISGFSCDHLFWQNVIADLTRDYQVITIDNRGAGQSDCPDDPYTIDIMADDIAELCNHLQYQKIHVIGVSMGGVIAMALAAKYPELVRTAVISNSPIKIDFKFKLVAAAHLIALESKVNSEIVIYSSLAWSFSSKFLDRPDIVDNLVEMRKTNPYPISAVGYRAQLNALTTADTTVWLPKINTPCLIIGSDQDIIVNESETQEIANAIKNSEYYCFKDTGHVPHIERPKVFTKLVLEFIAKYE